MVAVFPNLSALTSSGLNETLEYGNCTSVGTPASVVTREIVTESLFAFVVN